jgi:hypothetical protein
VLLEAIDRGITYTAAELDSSGADCGGALRPKTNSLGNFDRNQASRRMVDRQEYQ